MVKTQNLRKKLLIFIGAFLTVLLLAVTANLFAFESNAADLTAVTINVDQNTTVTAPYGEDFVDKTDKNSEIINDYHAYVFTSNVSGGEKVTEDDGFTVKYYSYNATTKRWVARTTAPRNAGTYYVNITREADDTYAAFDNLFGTKIDNSVSTLPLPKLIITPIDISVKWTPDFENLIYDGTTKTYTVELVGVLGSDSNVAVGVRAPGSGDACQIGQFKYEVSYTGTRTQNYIVKENRYSPEQIILPRDIGDAVHEFVKELTYNTAEQKIELKTLTSGGLDLMEFVVIENDKGTNAGKYTLKLTGTGNFTGTKNIEWEIKKQTYTDFSFDSCSKIQTGGLLSIAITGRLPDEIKVEYVGAFKEPGTYDIVAKFTTSDNYNPIPDMHAKLTINVHSVESTENGNVIISANNGINPNWSISLTDKTADADIPKDIIKEMAGSHAELKFLYDISLLNGTAEVQPDGKVTVKLLIPEEARSSANLTAYHVTEEGLEKISTARKGDYIIFTTEHFSSFAIIGDKPVTNINWLIIALAIIFAGLLVAMVVISVRSLVNSKKLAAVAPIYLIAAYIPASKWILLIIFAILDVLAVLGLIYIIKHPPKFKVKLVEDDESEETAEENKTEQASEATAEVDVEAEAKIAEQVFATVEETAAAPAVVTAEERKTSKANDMGILAEQKTDALDRSFMSKLIQDSEIQKLYSNIKNYIQSYVGIKFKTSWLYEVVTISSAQIFKFVIADSKLVFFTSLQSRSLPAESTAKITKSRKFVNTPTYIEITDADSLKAAFDIVDATCKLYELEKQETDAVDYKFDYEDDAALIERNLIKRLAN